MHPILFRVPLPHSTLQWAWLFFGAAIVAALIAGYQFFKEKNKGSALIALGFAAGFVALRFGLQSRLEAIEMQSFPIYSYGVMLGASLVVGWFLTLGLAERDGLPRDMMGDCYVDTAIMAVIGSRVLYIVTNLEQFDAPSLGETIGKMLSFRSGGLVAYGGFLGGWLGSWLYLRYGIGVLTTLKRLASSDLKQPWRPLPVLPWADVAVPSLASGLMITRVGCYLFGCDFGQPLKPNAPGWLKTLGTFPHWATGTIEHGDGAPAWKQHLDQGLISSGADASLPVHPTQIYESLVGAAVLVTLLLARKKQKFRGQICFLFFFVYGICRYLLEVVRDDAERGSLPFALPAHVLIPIGLVVFAVGYCIGFSQAIENQGVRRVTQFASFLPAIAFYFLLKPETFGEAPNVQWSTSQFIAMGTGFAGCIGFNILYKGALAHPERSMALGLPSFDAPAKKPVVVDEEDDEDDEEDDAPAPPKKKPVASKAKSVSKPKPKSDPPEPADGEPEAARVGDEVKES